jgi:hypothetical protein
MQVPTENFNMSEDQLSELQEELTIDFDLGYAIKDQVIPRAVEWYTGEIAPFNDDDEYYDDEDEAAEPEYTPPPSLPPPPRSSQTSSKRR